MKIYQRDVGTTKWNQCGSTIVGTMAGDDLGRSPSLSQSGQRLTIGAPRHDNGDLRDAGRVVVYEWNEDTLGYVQLGNALSGMQPVTNLEHQCASMAMAHCWWWGQVGKTVASPGYVKVYNWDGRGWELMGQAISGNASGDEFLGSTSISHDGKILAIGANQMGNGGPGYV